MKIAILSDIHGNYVALNAVLRELKGESIDQFICLGDVAGTGPQPRECLESIQQLNCAVVMGNVDAWLLDPKLTNPDDGDTKIIEEIDMWCAEQLSDEHREFIASFKERVSLKSHKLLAFHGSPRSFDDVINSTTPLSELEPMLNNTDAEILVGGHTHEATVRRLGDSLYINPGSIGLPFEINRETGDVGSPPWAEYALIEFSDSTTAIELRRVNVKPKEIIEAALNSDMPHTAWWTNWWNN
jgi:putative phosphoesterase